MSKYGFWMFLAIKVGIIASHVTPAPETKNAEVNCGQGSVLSAQNLQFLMDELKKKGLRAWLKKEEKKKERHYFKKNDKEQH